MKKSTRAAKAPDNVTTIRPGITPEDAIAKHPRLELTLEDDDKRGSELFPRQLLCAFLDRLEHKFPGMRMVVLRPCVRYDSYGDLFDVTTCAAFSWTTEAILEARLLSQSMVPMGRKRLWRGDHPFVTEVVKRGAGRLDVYTSIPQDVPPTDPLAIFSPDSIEFKPPPSRESQEASTSCDPRSAADWKIAVRGYCKGTVGSVVPILCDGIGYGTRFHLDEGCRARIQARVGEYIAELLREIDRARVIDNQQPQPDARLRLVVDNTREGAR